MKTTSCGTRRALAFPLTFGFNAGNAGGAVGFGVDFGLDRILEHPEPDTQFITLSTVNLELLRDTFEKLVEYGHTPLDLRTPLRQFREMLQLPRSSKLRFLALVAILESLLTHSPKPADPADSITRQVVSKVGLLNNRFIAPLPYGDFFGSLSPEKVWKRLYAARSAIAHGSTPDFSRELRDAQHATHFLMRSVSAVLRQALDEPQLLLDLRRC